jgi:hypothetical protein
LGQHWFNIDEKMANDYISGGVVINPEERAQFENSVAALDDQTLYAIRKRLKHMDKTCWGISFEVFSHECDIRSDRARRKQLEAQKAKEERRKRYN